MKIYRIVTALLIAGAIQIDAHALDGGTDLTTEEQRIGVLQVNTYDGSVYGGSCTATVLYSSASKNQSWVVTAAHCFSDHDKLYFVYHHFQDPKAIVQFDTDAEPVGPEASKVYVHPDWLANGGHTAWFGPHDVAFIHIDAHIPLFDSNGAEIREYRRPIYTGSSISAALPGRAVHWIPSDVNVFCGQRGGRLKCDRLDHLWYSPNFRSEFFQMPLLAWENANLSPPFQPGDSGGPLLMYSSEMSRQWEGTGDLETAARQGVVLGVLQGPAVYPHPDCFIPFGDCTTIPPDGLVAHFSGMDPWIDSLPNGNLIPTTGQSCDGKLSQIEADPSTGFEYGSTRMGSDDYDFEMTCNAEPADCEAACDADTGCASWSFVEGGIQEEHPHCWLKSAIPGRSVSEGVVSGVVRAIFEVEIGRNGSDFENRTVADAAACRDACIANTKCRTFTFVESSSQCWLKDDAPQPFPQAGRTSGLVREDGIEYAVDHFGSDLRSFPLDVANPKMCRKACIDEPKCVTWEILGPWRKR